MDVYDQAYRAANRERWERLPRELRDRAVSLFYRFASGETRDRLLTGARVSSTYIVDFHYRWGEAFCNALREEGLKDGDLPAALPAPAVWHAEGGWEDWYVAIVEGALGLYDGPAPGR